MSQAPLDQYLLTPLQEIADESRRQPWDALVVGGGTAGLSAARALVEEGRRVAVVEGGPLGLLTHSSTTDLRFDSGGLDRYRALLQYSPRSAAGGNFGALIACVGGRALFWNGAAPRFADSDFSAWPIGLEDLAPFYDWAERDFRVTTDYGQGGLQETVVRTLRRAGLNATDGPYAVDTSPTHNRWIGGTVGNPLASLLRSNLLTAQPPLLRLADHSFATRILVRDGRVSGLAVSDQTTRASVEIDARSVVLAAGGFESVRLAMKSQVPDKSGRMGRAIADHLFCRAYYPVAPSFYDPAKPEAAIVAIRADAQRAFQIELHMPGDDLFTLNEFSTWQPAEERFYAAMVRSFAPVAPRDANFIELGPSDAPGDYTVHLTYSSADKALLEEMVKGLDQVRAALGGGQAFQLQTFNPGDSHHEGGGLAMGSDASAAVTDPHGRFYSLPNLQVVDASSWPTVSACNPCLTINALARRQAKQLHRDLASG